MYKKAYEHELMMKEVGNKEEEDYIKAQSTLKHKKREVVYGYEHHKPILFQEE